MTRAAADKTEDIHLHSRHLEMEVVHLDADDDLVSVFDRLDWCGVRQILLILPQDGDVFQGGLDLPRLRRYADRQRKEIGLVTTNRTLVRQAKSLGLPAFSSVKEGLTSRRGWWRGRRRTERVGLPPDWRNEMVPVPQALSEAIEAPRLEQVSRRHWIMRYFTIVMFLVTVSFLIIALAYMLPRATIALRPAMSSMQATVEITADPGASDVNYSEALIPARLLFVDLAWQAEGDTSGSELVPLTPARGRVIFRNLTAEEIEVPAGTQVSSRDGRHNFQTIAPVTMVRVISSTAEVEAVALDAGPQNNIEAGSIVRIEGQLAESLTVTNPVPMSGGDFSVVATVTDQDRLRLRSQVLQFLQAVAMAEIETKLTEREFLARESLRVVEVSNETYSHLVGDKADTIRLKVEARLQGTAIDLTEAAGLAYDSLTGRMGADSNLVTDSIVYEQGEVLETDKDGRVKFVMMAEGLATADIDLNSALETISGQSPEVATAYLYDVLPLHDVPAIEIWPQWFDRVPYMTKRIEAEVVAFD